MSYQDEEWLRTQYVERRLSIRECAEKADCAASTIVTWLDHYDIERRSRGRPPDLDPRQNS